MTRRPFDPGETGELGPDMESTLSDLDRYLADTAEFPSPAFADQVMDAVGHEPAPRRGVLGALLTFFATPSSAGRTVLLAATVAVAILAVVAIGQVGNLLPPSVGNGTPSPPQVSSPSPEPSPSLSPSPSPRETRSPRPSSSAAESPEPSDDGNDAGESPDANDDSGHGGSGNSGSGSDGSSGKGG